MSVYVDTESILTVAEISQYLSQQSITRNINKGDGDVNVTYPRLLYCVRQAVQWAYEQNPNDETINVTANYLYALCARYINAAQTIADNEACSVPIILVQPVSQSAAVDDNVTLSVTAYSLAAMTYQWYFNGVLSAGNEESILVLNSLEENEFGSYTVKVTTACGSVMSNAAVLTNDTPSAEQIFYYGVKDTSGTPDEAYILANSSTASGDASVDVSLHWDAQASPYYYFFALPVVAGSEKTYWFESTFNQGNIGGLSNLFGSYSVVAIDGIDYYVWTTNFATQFVDNNYVFS